MPLRETPLEMSQRHVTEWEKLVADQIAHINDLAKNHHSTTEAEEVLASLKNHLAVLQEELAQRKARYASIVKPNLPPETPSKS